MSKPYDAATKALIETDPAGWVAFLGCAVPTDAVSLLDADLSTVSAEADKVIRVEQPDPWLLHLELQASRDDSLERRLLRYNALLHHRHGLPVWSVAVLLRPAANIPIMQGELRFELPIGTPWAFRYGVVRVWEQSPTSFLDGPVGLIPLAPMADLAKPDQELPALIGRMKDRFDVVAEPEMKNKLWIATYVLMGLRYNQSVIENLLHGVRDMEESVTYQAIVKRGLQQGLQQGSVSEARKLLLRAGRRLGAVPPAVNAALDAIDDTAKLESLFDRVLTAASWDELLKTP